MAQDTENFNKELYNLLKVRGYEPVPLDSKNQRVPASQAADVIQFTFIKDGEDYGKVWLTIDEAKNVIVYYDEEQQKSPSGKTPGVEYDDSWTGFLKHVKNWAQRRQLSFELLNKDRLSDDMRQRDYYKMKERVAEGYYPMGKKASYNDAVPNVKIVLQHNRALEEGEQRYRNVAKIYLENVDGERFLAPTTRPGIARVYARHIAEGGVPNDDRWNHIKSICEDYTKMAGFVRATRNGQFNESAQELVTEGINHYNGLRETLSKMTGHRGYQAYFESWTPALMENEGDESINELFVQETMDPRIESAMPILSRLRKPVAEMSEVDTLAEWADSIISEKLEIDEGDVVPFKKKKQDDDDDDDDSWLDDDSWIPSIEDFEQEEAIRNRNREYQKRKRTPANDIDENFINMAPQAVAEEEMEEATGYYDKKHTQHDRMTKDGYEHSEDDIQGKKMHRYYKPGESLTDLYKYNDEKLDEVGDTDAGQEALAKTWRRAGSKAFRAKHAKDEYEHGYTAAQLNKEREKHRTVARQADERLKPETERFTYVKEEGLDANQKRVGQLGPTGAPAKVGDLVGANESVEYDELARIIDIARLKR